MHCCQTLRRNRKWPIEGTLRRLLKRFFQRKSEGGKIDVLVVGPASRQSRAWATGETKRLGSRATALEAYLRVLAEAQPRVFLLENVEDGFSRQGRRFTAIQLRLR